MNEGPNELIAAKADALFALFGCFGLVFMSWSKAVISIIVIYDELPLVAMNYCVLEPVEATLLLSDQPFCQHQSVDNECIFIFG